jgi:hypothetical protein
MFISENTTPFLAETFTYQDKHCVKWCVAVVRATFDVDAYGDCQASREQTPFVYADTHYGDPETTSVRVESDFSPIKPKCEVLLDAVAMAPPHVPVETLEVGLFGPCLQKRAIITGMRRWARGVLGVHASRPTPFQTLPLAWHLTFGGWDRSDPDPAKHRSDAVNPIGTGFLVEKAGVNTMPLLPCIEDPKSRMRDWNDRPVPIGFGPVSRFAETRARHAGTYDQHWMENVMPFLPPDFDDHYFQSAPLDQQGVSLAEGTTFDCLNMNATGRFRVRLPKVMLPVRFVYNDRTIDETLTPDTLTIVPHESRIVLVGRVRTKLPRKFVTLQQVQVGKARNKRTASKPHYAGLGVAVDALTKLRGRL